MTVPKGKSLPEVAGIEDMAEAWLSAKGQEEAAKKAREDAAETIAGEVRPLVFEMETRGAPTYSLLVKGKPHPGEAVPHAVEVQFQNKPVELDEEKAQRLVAAIGPQLFASLTAAETTVTLRGELAKWAMVVIPELTNRADATVKEARRAVPDLRERRTALRGQAGFASVVKALEEFEEYGFAAPVMKKR